MTVCSRLAPPLLALLLGGCGSVGYYAQSARGQLALMGGAAPIEELLRSPDTPPQLAERLRLVQQLRDFASERLALPDNGSYRSYADIGRRAVVWSVMAAPRYSVEPKRWCYPLLGCLVYRGYFSRDAALAEGARLRALQMDVAVLPVPAYSTLGWFEDPLPSSVIHWPEPELAGLMFHELAHQRLYVADDTAFNEAYASAVAKLGIRQWLDEKSEPYASWEAREARGAAVAQLLLQTRKRLAAAFAQAADDAEREQRKQAIYRELVASYEHLSAGWPEPRPYGHWFADGQINNAHLVQVATYDQWVPAFERLWMEQGQDPRAFHAAAASLGALPPEQRRRRLQALSGDRVAP